MSGQLFIGVRGAAGRTTGSRGSTAATTFRAENPATGESLEPAFAAASPADVDVACELAWQAFHVYRQTSRKARAAFLAAIGEQILALGDELLERGHAESGLPIPRLSTERGRTVGQLRLFADEVAAGGWLGVRIDPALPGREPLPRPDLRQRRIPLGPVAVFGASNFPLAFSVAGGDTASALAAGCPVIVKGHQAHPGTSDLVAQAVVAAAAASGMPDGVFSLLNTNNRDTGAALVAHPRIKAVGFTGSRAGGLALRDIANGRPEPIPVYAEMSSVNPVVLLPGALAGRSAALANGFVASMTLGVGQFCTNPGLVFALDGPDLDAFLAAAGKALGGVTPATMLTRGIHSAYESGVQKLMEHGAVTLVARGADKSGTNCGRGALFAVAGDALVDSPEIMDEVFGAASVVVRCRDETALLALLDNLEGQLTATLHLTPADHPLAARLLPVLERRAGRILVNGWPTGVEVCHAMVHGGPFPATSDSRSTSVGTLAIERFLRPVCYQDVPQELLPPELRDDAADLPRRVDGRFEAP
ncbi:MAG TPA: aldehyde dehydrogenase (NADP(+)) [Woeseiaceae bacterium]|nr:aldehyde dehydrogenase (NADP(+)) [Woeseiaceae bacterium]